MAPIPEISLRLQSPAISLELPIAQTNDSGTYTAELKTFTGDQTLLTENFIRPVSSDGSAAVEIIVPADLLAADTYYTAHLHSPDRSDHFHIQSS